MAKVILIGNYHSIFCDNTMSEAKALKRFEESSRKIEQMGREATKRMDRVSKELNNKSFEEISLMVKR